MTDTLSYAELSDEELLSQCRVEIRRGSGPGGQHRNKVESAVRLTHEPTGVTAGASERRSQFANRRLALERLRAKLEERFRPVVERVATRKSRSVREREKDLRVKLQRRRRLRARPRVEDGA